MRLGKCHSESPPARMPSFTNPHFPVCSAHKGLIQNRGTPTWGRKQLQFISHRQHCHKDLKHPKKSSFHKFLFLAKKSTHCFRGNNWRPTPTAESTVPGRAVPSLLTSWAEGKSTLCAGKEADRDEKSPSDLTRMRHMRGLWRGSTVISWYAKTTLLTILKRKCSVWASTGSCRTTHTALRN